MLNILFYTENPISIFSSILGSKQMCNNDVINLDKYLIDLNKGFDKLGNLPEKIKKQAYTLEYEDLVENPELYTKEICQYLNIDFDSEMLTEWQKSSYKGKAGDKEGVKKYTTISTKSVDKYSITLNNYYRKYIATRYIKSLDKDILNNMGYNKQTLLNELSAVNTPLNLIDSIKDMLKYTIAKCKYKIRNKILGV